MKTLAKRAGHTPWMAADPSAAWGEARPDAVWTAE